MKKYLYIFNYPPQQQQLCALEFKYLFNDVFTSKYYFSDLEIDINISVFIKARIDCLASSTCFKELVEKINKQSLYYLDFKVIYIKNEITAVDYQESLQWCRDIAHPIDGTVSMVNPQHTIAITKMEDIWIVGEYHHGIPLWKKHNDKPQTFSNSLDIRIARTLVNIASCGNRLKSIIDPCCGVGTVVLEGIGLGLNIVGFDISQDIVYQARTNLAYYGYDKNIINVADIHDLKQHYDVAIMDIPYNLYTPITHQEQCALISSARKLCNQLLIVTYEDMEIELQQADFKIIDQCIIKKTEYCSFQRRVYICI